MRTFLLFLLSANFALGQSGLEIEGYWTTGTHSGNLTFFDIQVTDYSVSGYTGYLTYSYEIENWKTTFSGGLTVKRLAFSGSTNDNQTFDGTSLKFGMVLGARYNITDRWDAGLRFLTENNRDEKRFRISTSDLMRYNLEVTTSYEVLKNLSISAFYSKGLYPLLDYYLLYNPEHQFAIGLRYEIL